ncbi:MAG: hypothetical protein IJ480_12355 [Clostridia bacterium]|nr:hypothetical protein [Clostridia bacterium]
MMYAQIQQKLCTQTVFLPEIGRITYILTEDTLPNGEHCYSITVQYTDSSPSNTILESRTVRDVTADRHTAFCLFWQVCRGTVTPCTLTEVLSDLLS